MVMLSATIEAARTPQNLGIDSQQSPIVLCNSFGGCSAPADAAAATKKSLRLMMLGCEDNPPYGPTEHTAKLFLELVSQTLKECSAPSTAWTVSITIFRVKLGQYPDDWDAYDGILLPGSFSAAYDDDPWIEKLKQVIQTEIVSNHRPTMGICFGHQVFAHSFALEGGGGKANKHIGGSRGGRYAMKTTKAGQSVFGEGKDTIELFYTHGDMVEKLPTCAVPLGEEGKDLPIQSAAYFKDEVEANKFLTCTADPSMIRPYAVTFQAHPEYAVSPELGLECTLNRILEALGKLEILTKEMSLAATQDAAKHFDEVHRSSKDAFIAAAKALGWFP